MSTSFRKIITSDDHRMFDQELDWSFKLYRYDTLPFSVLTLRTPCLWYSVHRAAVLLYSRKYSVVQQSDDAFLVFCQPWVATTISNFADVKRICQRKRDDLCKQTPEQRRLYSACLSLLRSHLKNGHHFYVDRKNAFREQEGDCSRGVT